MATSTNLTIVTDNGIHAPLVIRGFTKAKEPGTVVLTGTEFEDHELWHLANGTAQLIGTLTDKCYRQLRRTRNLMLTCDHEHFVYVDKPFEGKKLVGRIAAEVTPQSYSYAA